MEKVNINTAVDMELQKIIHIGPIRATDIIYQTTIVKPFKDIYELSTILGLGPKRMRDIIEQNIAEV